MCYVFYGDDLSIIVYYNFYYDGCFSACSYNLSYLLIIFKSLICFREYLSFFGYDVGFVDVVKFDYRSFYIKF